MVQYLSFHKSTFALKIIFNVNGKATQSVSHPLFFPWNITLFIWFFLEHNYRPNWQVVGNTLNNTLRFSPAQHWVWSWNLCGIKEGLYHWTIIPQWLLHLQLLKFGFSCVSPIVFFCGEILQNCESKMGPAKKAFVILGLLLFFFH
jgi:hypothetical protein